MMWSYEYTPYIWAVLASVALLTVLLIQGIRQRSAPGAVPFIFLVAAAIQWIIGNGLSTASTDDAARIFWFKFQIAFNLPLVTAGLCFAAEYAGLGRLLTRRTIAALAAVPIVFALLIVTNHIHHLVWTRIWLDGYVRSDEGVAIWSAMAYGYFLSLLQLLILGWLFVRSPRHRGITTALVMMLLITRGVTILNAVHWIPIAPTGLIIVVTTLALLPYAVAVFRFHMFDVVSVARNTIIERMADAIVVLDNKNRIVDLNGTAETILGLTKCKAIGNHVIKALSAWPDLLVLTGTSGETQCEIHAGKTRYYQASTSLLVDDRGFQLGRIISLHEITDLKRAQARVLDQQRTMAVLNERELLARDLHDGLGQALAAAQLQVASARELLSKGDSASAEACLRRVSEATQEAKESIRQYLLGVKARSSQRQGLIPVLRQYLAQYRETYGIHTELVVPTELEKQQIDAVVELQLQPIIQEALTNARKHGQARSARVVFSQRDGQLHVTIEDDGCGLDLNAVVEHKGFGLRSMRGRAEAIGGVLEVNSKPGKGTRVSVQIPYRREEA
jgi:PAS domain S-box-containing protein